MKKNMGGIDRGLRLVVGATLIGWAVMSGNLWGYIGIIPLATALIGWCPVYLPFGIKTCRISNHD
ncbi:MAG: DUF2892 domain-containing protein [Gammaproteobacteria bacterium]|nr:DUF2892 domain-containing protein [Gammaproteobacteria bacterium]